MNWNDCAPIYDTGIIHPITILYTPSSTNKVLRRLNVIVHLTNARAQVVVESLERRGGVNEDDDVLHVAGMSEPSAKKAKRLFEHNAPPR